MIPAWAYATAAFIAAWLVLYLVVRGTRGPLTVYPFLLVYRLRYSRAPYAPGTRARLIRAYGLVSVPLAMVSAALFYYVSATLFIGRYIAPTQAASQEGFVPLIPGVTVGLNELIYILLAVGVAVLVHELSHAVVARSVGVPIRSAGFLLLAFIPAAFVEPDEEAMKAARVRSKAMIYSAGVAANLALGLTFMYLAGYLAAHLANGVQIISVQPGSPASHAGLQPGMVIVAVNGTPVRTVEQGLRALIRSGAEGSGAAVVTLSVLYQGLLRNLTVFKPAGYTRLGIEVAQAFSIPWLMSFVSAMYVVNFGLALVNAAPLAFPLPGFGVESDGGQALREALSRFRAGREAAAAVELLTLLLLLSLITIAPVRLP